DDLECLSRPEVPQIADDEFGAVGTEIRQRCGFGRLVIERRIDPVWDDRDLLGWKPLLQKSFLQRLGYRDDVVGPMQQFPLEAEQHSAGRLISEMAHVR